MAEKTVTLEGALTELEEARSGVEEAQKALTDAESVKAEKVEQIKTLIDDLKAKAKELGLEVVANVEEAQEAVSQKLDEAKAEWAQTAAENPNEARRQVRLVWAVIGTVVGFVLGCGAGYLFALI
jgi:hypothetical protein